MSAMPDGYPVPAMRASDADRDAVVSALSEHFQAGRLTTDELEERTGRALAARTLGELDELTADLPGPRVAQPPQPAAQAPQPLPTHPGWLVYRAPVPIIAVVAALVFVALAVGASVGNHSLLWLLVPAVIIARAGGLRRRSSSSRSSRRSRWD